MKKGRIVLTVSRVANIAPEMKAVYLRLGKQVYTYDRETDSYLAVPAVVKDTSARDSQKVEAVTDVSSGCVPEAAGAPDSTESRGGLGLKVPRLGSRTVKANGKIPRIMPGKERLPQLPTHEAPLPQYPRETAHYREKPLPLHSGEPLRLRSDEPLPLSPAETPRHRKDSLPLRPEEPLPLRSEEPLRQYPEETPRYRKDSLPLRPEEPSPSRREEPLPLRSEEPAKVSAEPTPAHVPREEPRPGAVAEVQRPEEVEVKVVPTPRKRQTRVPKTEGEPPAPATSKPLKVIRRRAEQAPKVFETTTTRFPKAMLEGIKVNLDEEREVQ